MSYIIQNIILEDGGGRGWNLISVMTPPAFSICPIRSFTAVVASFNVSNRRKIRFIGLHVKAFIYKEWGCIYNVFCSRKANPFYRISLSNIQDVKRAL
jgi:hypothetical protein